MSWRSPAWCTGSTCFEPRWLAALPAGLARPGRRRPVRRRAAPAALQAVWERGGKREARGRLAGAMPGRAPAASARRRLVAYARDAEALQPRHPRDVARRAGVAHDRGGARSGRAARCPARTPLDRAEQVLAVPCREAAAGTGGWPLYAPPGASPRDVGAPSGDALHRRLRSAGGGHRAPASC